MTIFWICWALVMAIGSWPRAFRAVYRQMNRRQR